MNMGKFFRTGLLLTLVAVVVSVPVYAAGPDDDAPPSETGEVTEAPTETTTETVVTEDDKTIVVNVTVPSAAAPASDDPEASPGVEMDPMPSDEPTYQAYTVTALNDVPQEDPDALSAVVSNLFGTYTPRTQTVTEYLADGSSVTYDEVIPGVAGLDWPWLAGVGLFGLSLWSLFLLIGGVLKRG